ncbi:MAG: hypothetical protein CUN56_06850 [Phototrophicales bacterium]|nr:MAG: hypothetical protein CUN56_06850 [Phototrophicales bacterium]
MPRKLKIAAIQMDATPAPTAKRLACAEMLIKQAVDAGADLVVLPELFNIGYRYHANNYRHAEPFNGQTVTWMRQQAALHRIHLAGTLLLRDADEVYNTALLFSPDGRNWRYDKNYPWAWERAYFRESESITIADTDLGNLGMMICWDYAHPELWQRYAGRVDAIIIMSCPPTMHQLRLVFPNKTLIIGDRYYTGNDTPFGTDLDLLAAWMRVPVINTTGSGTFRTAVPRPLISMIAASLLHPRLLGYLWQAKQATIEGAYYQQTKIINPHGYVIARGVADSNQVVVGDVELADEQPTPIGPHPKFPYTRLAYFISDTFLPWLMLPVYRRGYRRIIGAQMAPIDRTTRFWQWVVVGAFGLGWLLGRFGKYKR